MPGLKLPGQNIPHLMPSRTASQIARQHL